MRRGLLAVLLGALLLGAPAGAAAAPAPAWSLSSLAVPTHFEPGGEEEPYYLVEATNIGAALTDASPIVLRDTLPAGLGVEGVELWLPKSLGKFADFGDQACSQEAAGETVTVSCEIEESLPGAFEPALLGTSERLILVIYVAVPGGSSGPLANQVEIEGGGAGAAALEEENQASEDPPPPGIDKFSVTPSRSDGGPATGAASHPFLYTTSFALNTEVAPEGSIAPVLGVGGDLKDVEVQLPPGLIGNPTVAERCTAKQFTTLEEIIIDDSGFYLSECPDSAAVGTISVAQVEGTRGGEKLGAIYNLVPPPGMPAQFGFQIAGLPIYIDTELRSGGDYGVTARVRNASQVKRVSAATISLWGVPADPAHDRQRGVCADSGRVVLETCPAGVPTVRPFMRLPSSCADPLSTLMRSSTWFAPETFFEATDTEAAPLGCELPGFSPSIEAKPTTTVADSPSGLDFNLHLPQNEDPEGLGSADLRDATVTLPEGLLVNPASAAGLQGCSPAQIGLASPVGQVPPSFSPEPADCPDGSKVGRVEVSTPLIDHPLPGSVYLATQSANPFGSLIAIYITVDDPETGIVVKLAGKATPDPLSGRLTTTVTANPQTPFEDFRLEFFAGPRGPLRTPAACGTHTTTTSLTPHTAPASGPPATPSDSFEILSGPAGPCPSGTLDPKLSTGLDNPTAAAYSPFRLRLTRADGTDEFEAVQSTAPEGLAARLAGIPNCPEAAIGQALGRWGLGQGALEAASPSCPAASRIGSVTAGAGAGPSPFYTSGSVYLAGPYRGAPLSLLAVVPAVAGPFDLGAVANRIALRVNPKTAQVSAQSDPLPTVLAGIPLDVRDIRVDLDRPGFTLAPTSCAPMSVDATVRGRRGALAARSERFQVGGCRGLGFKPRIALRLFGATHRGAYQGLRAVLRTRPGDANIGRTVVRMPRSAFLAQEHIRTVCTRVQFAAGACPKGAVYGRAVAYSPLLDHPVKGPVYLRSSDNTLPDLIADLRGPDHQPVRVELSGRTDSARGALRNTFDVVPDVPASYFRLQLFGANRGLIVNSRDICRGRNRAAVRLDAQNGRRLTVRPLLRNSRCAKQQKRRAARSGHRRRG